MKLPISTHALLTALLASLCALTVPAMQGAEPVISSAPRASICLNGQWEVAPGGDGLTIPTEGWSLARVPAAPILDPKVTAQWCRLTFTVPKDWAATDRRFFIEFEKVGHYGAVFCNGRKIGEHFGQYTPFEFDLTDALHVGERNELTVFVHNASGKFVRPGADITDPMIGNAYRPAANQQSERNWVGISGDVTFSWRPQHGIADVFVDTSVRQKTLTASVETHLPDIGKSPAKLHATVLDGDATVLDLPPVAVAGYGTAKLANTWANPVLWGSAPYGEPKLYTLRTELVTPEGQILDRVFTRFGFREVWLSGQDVMLNGRKLWLAGLYHGKHSAARDLNDRRPMAAMTSAMRSSGLNTLHGHWDDLGRPWLDLCDETGMFVVAGFFCDGRPQIQSSGEAAWSDWMTATCAEWVRARRNHPSILIWRPTDVVPNGTERFISLDDFRAAIAAQVRKYDPAHRPIADGSDIAAWGQPPEDRATGEYTNFAPIQTGHDTGKPFMCKEIYGGFNSPDKYATFVREFYQRSFALGSTGVLVQQLPILRSPSTAPLAISWLSQSGTGNRDTSLPGIRNELPNWCDPNSPPLVATPYATLFHDLFQQYMRVELKPAPVSSADVLVNGLSPRSFAFLLPENAAGSEPHGWTTASDGSLWLAGLSAGPWRLTQDAKSTKIEVTLPAAPTEPGYSQVQRVQAAP